MSARLTLALWAAGFLGNMLLWIILLLRRQWSHFPLFTILAGYESARALFLFVISQTATHSVYVSSYWSSEAVDILLQVGLLYEVGSLTIFSRSIDASSLSSRVVSRSTLAFAVAIAGACSLAMPSATTVKDTIDMRACLFTSLLTCELYLLILTKANRLRLKMTRSVRAISNGITLWAVCAIVSDVIHQLGGWENRSIWFEHFKSIIVVSMLFYWITIFWRAQAPAPNNPSTAPISSKDSYLHRNEAF